MSEKPINIGAEFIPIYQRHLLQVSGQGGAAAASRLYGLSHRLTDGPVARAVGKCSCDDPRSVRELVRSFKRFTFIFSTGSAVFEIQSCDA